MFTPEGNQSNNSFAAHYTPNISWLDGHYEEGHISTAFSHVMLFDYFWQGSEAEEIIEQIHEIWVKNNLTQQQAVSRWIELNL